MNEKHRTETATKSLCETCGRADVDCPTYPQQTQSCVEHRTRDAATDTKPAARDVLAALANEIFYETTEAARLADDGFGVVFGPVDLPSIVDRYAAQAAQQQAVPDQHDEPGTIIRQFGYQPLFNAISSATQWREGRTIEISVLAFQKALLAATQKGGAR